MTKMRLAKEIWIQLQGTEPKYLVGNKDVPKLAFLVDNVRNYKRANEAPQTKK